MPYYAHNFFLDKISNKRKVNYKCTSLYKVVSIRWSVCWSVGVSVPCYFWTRKLVVWRSRIWYTLGYLFSSFTITSSSSSVAPRIVAPPASASPTAPPTVRVWFSFLHIVFLFWKFCNKIGNWKCRLRFHIFFRLMRCLLGILWI